jgi:MscS family membrane protein
LAVRTSCSVTLSCLLLLWICGSIGATAQAVHPLAPPDTSSPRATLKTFLDSTNSAVEAYKRGNTDEARALMEPAIGCLNLEKDPPEIRHALGMHSAIYLKEVLDRIQLPPDEEIPDEKTVQTQKISSWTIPYTEITIAAVKEGSPTGRFLFTSDTVRNAETFYDKVEKLPYRPGTGGGALYKQLISRVGVLIPKSIIDGLPHWTRAEMYGQAAWQWIGLALYLFIGAAIVFLIYFYGRKTFAFLDRKFNSHIERHAIGLILPVTLILFAKVGLWVTVYGLNIMSTNAYEPIAYGLTVLIYLGAVWFIGSLLNRVADLVIHIGRFSRGDMDIQLIRLGFQILIVIVVIIAIIHLSSRLGLPTYSLLTGLGIGGLAVALAGREALSNIIGTISIMLDRPFKLGDFVVLGEGDRGIVTEIGLRSTLITRLDGIRVSMPNANIANMKIVNESAPVAECRISVAVGVAYGSSVSEVEQALLTACQRCEYVVSEPAPWVRLVRFGDSAVEFELLVWIIKPEFREKATDQINRSIGEEFHKKGIEMPFPQRDIHIRTTA